MASGASRSRRAAARRRCSSAASAAIGVGAIHRGGQFLGLGGELAGEGVGGRAVLEGALEPLGGGLGVGLEGGELASEVVGELDARILFRAGRRAEGDSERPLAVAVPAAHDHAVRAFEHVDVDPVRVGREPAVAVESEHFFTIEPDDRRVVRADHRIDPGPDAG